MHDILKTASQVSHFTDTDKSDIFRFHLDGIQAEGYLSVNDMVVATRIANEPTPDEQWLQYITLLLGGHPDIHDQAFKIMQGGIWLCMRYDNSVTVENVSVEIGRQLSLTRYFRDVIHRFDEHIAGE